MLLLVLLPESVRYMVAKNEPVERIRAVLRRISASAANATSFVMSEKATMAQPEGKSGIGVVLSSSYVVGSVMLWITYFMGSGDLLRADQLDADPVQGCGVGAAQRGAHLGIVPAGASGRSCSAG